MSPLRPQPPRSRPGFARIGLLTAAGLLAALTTSDAEAARRRAANFDGTWNVVFATRAGNCSPTYNAPFAVQGRRVASAGGGKVTGGITGGGNVAVRISVGASVANGRGRLAGTTGTGTWSGVIQGDRCHGVWQATRS
ncbi:hypothetical protein LPW26_18545 [Rhodopseudomonas sp. HC1]|uniref:hypothetical protein n=1 Tax=Rhodopseudomonas infernalis TaxID=2897386 RepID=UPI001EE878AC|nr:hypothetical protein [Rhodopseudomonas infernalis]MCG6206653.1 hypothetical protein [Rhodopseudomonas infernalis]